MKIKTKRDRDNQTAYERRRIALSYLSEKEFADIGLRFIDPYKKDLDLKLPVSLKEKFNTLEGRIKEKIIGHQIRGYHIDKPKSSISFELRFAHNGKNPPCYIKMLSDQKTNKVYDDVKRFFGKTIFLYLHFSDRKQKTFNYYALHNIQDIINFYRIDYEISKGNKNRVSIKGFTPGWTRVDGARMKPFRYKRHPFNRTDPLANCLCMLFTEDY